jgi:hypothetical protein
MKALTKAVKQMLDALAHEHAGEHLSMKDKSLVLGEELDAINSSTGSKVFEPAKVRSSSNVRRVALYLGSELPSEVMDYVIETCSRLGHELTVLTFQSEISGRTLLRPHQQALDTAGVKMELVTLSGDPVSGLARYLRSHPEIAFLACKDSGYLGRSYLKGTQRTDALPVPVVVVTTLDEDQKPQDQAVSSEGNREVDVA